MVVGVNQKTGPRQHFDLPQIGQMTVAQTVIEYHKPTGNWIIIVIKEAIQVMARLRFEAVGMDLQTGKILRTEIENTVCVVLPGINIAAVDFFHLFSKKHGHHSFYLLYSPAAPLSTGCIFLTGPLPRQRSHAIIPLSHKERSFIMFALGTIVNTAAILLGGFLGLFFGGLLQPRHQDSLCKTCGVCTLFIGISGALEGMLTVSGTSVTGGGSLLIIGCLAIGAFLGELLNIEARFEQFGAWMKIKTGNARDKQFVDGFVTASLTVCIGAMAIVGAIQDGIQSNPSILFTKSVLDLIIITVMTCSMGKGCMFSAIPVAILQGSVTVLAKLLEPVMTPLALSNLSLVGSILIFCVGINLVWGKQIRVANLLPAIVIAVVAAFLPF